MQRKKENELKTVETYNQLLILKDILSKILPQYEVYNQYESFLATKLSDQQKVYLPILQDLSKQFTYLYRHSRITIKTNYYEVCKEDVLASLGLLQMQLSPLSTLKKTEFEFYKTLQLSNEKNISRKRAEEITGYCKTQTHRHLTKLYQIELIKRKGTINKGYIYNL